MSGHDFMGINRMKVETFDEMSELVERRNVSDAAAAAGVHAE